MAEEISDEMMAEYTITGSAQEMPGLIKERYNGLLDRVAFYYPYQPGQDEKTMAEDSRSVSIIKRTMGWGEQYRIQKTERVEASLRFL
jgi:hypothetical protein